MIIRDFALRVTGDARITSGTARIPCFVTAQAASCDVAAEHPACYLARQDWGIPVRVVPGGPDHLELMLLG